MGNRERLQAIATELRGLVPDDPRKAVPAVTIPAASNLITEALDGGFREGTEQGDSLRATLKVTKRQNKGLGALLHIRVLETVVQTLLPGLTWPGTSLDRVGPLLADLIEADLKAGTKRRRGIHRLKPLTEVQQQAFDLICDEGPLTGKEVVNRLGISSESNFTAHYVPDLKKHGIENRPGLGYYHPDFYTPARRGKR
jgi:hypothetical protein